MAIVVIATDTAAIMVVVMGTDMEATVAAITEEMVTTILEATQATTEGLVMAIVEAMAVAIMEVTVAITEGIVTAIVEATVAATT